MNPRAVFFALAFQLSNTAVAAEMSFGNVGETTAEQPKVRRVALDMTRDEPVPNSRRAYPARPGSSTNPDPDNAKLAFRSGNDQAPASEKPEKYVAGRHYQVLADEPPQPNTILLFGVISCHQCGPEKAALENWAKAHPDYKTEYIPAMAGLFGGGRVNTNVLAKADYLAQMIDKFDVRKPGDGSRSWRQKLATISPVSMQADSDIRKFFTGPGGITDQRYSKYEKSFYLNSHLRSAKKLSDRYRIRATPTYVVNGKYLVSRTYFYRNRAGEWDRYHNPSRQPLLNIVNALLDRDAPGGR